MIFENVKEIGRKKGLTIMEIEKRAGFSNGTIGKWQKSSPRVENVIKVSEVLGVSVSRLMK